MNKTDKLYIADQRMFELMEQLKMKGVITYNQEFLDAIEMRKQTVSMIRQQKQHFTVRHIELACKKYKVDANWIFGLQSRAALPVQTRLKQKI